VPVEAMVTPEVELMEPESVTARVPFSMFVAPP
jgi:hypothetical protein